jgi:hypothetical protein
LPGLAGTQSRQDCSTLTQDAILLGVIGAVLVILAASIT